MSVELLKKMLGRKRLDVVVVRSFQEYEILRARYERRPSCRWYIGAALAFVAVSMILHPGLQMDHLADALTDRV